MLLTDKYSPRKLSDFVGNPEPVEAMRKWAIDWARGKPGKPLLISGPPGTGKTAMAHAIANEMGWELLESNAGDTRNDACVSHILGAATSSSSLSGKMKLILIDDIDSVSGSDRGGMQAMTRLLAGARQPVAITALDAWDRKLSGVRSACTSIRLRRIAGRTVLAYLKKIAANEQIKASDEKIELIAEMCNGDLRSALNDLQAHNSGAERDRKKNVFDVVRTIFKASTYSEAREAAHSSDLEHDMLKAWIDENIPAEYETPEETAKAYDRLSRADVFDGRIYRRQYWGFLRYSSDLMTSGVALAKKERSHRFVNYAFPSNIRAMSASKGRRAMEKEVGKKIAKHCHCSSSEAKDYFHLIAEGAAKDILAIRDHYSFEEDELAFLMNCDADKTTRLVKKAEEEIEKKERAAEKEREKLERAEEKKRIVTETKHAKKEVKRAKGDCPGEESERDAGEAESHGENEADKGRKNSVLSDFM